MVTNTGVTAVPYTHGTIIYGTHSCIYGSFPLSGTVRYSTVQYAIMSISIVRSCEWYQNSEPYRTTFLVPFRWGT